MRILPERARWRIAHLLDKRPDQCWADLVGWVLRGGRRGEALSPWSPIGSACRSDVERIGSCYCGKLRGRASGLAGFCAHGIGMLDQCDDCCPPKGGGS